MQVNLFLAKKFDLFQSWIRTWKYYRKSRIQSPLKNLCRYDDQALGSATIHADPDLEFEKIADPYAGLYLKIRGLIFSKY